MSDLNSISDEFLEGVGRRCAAEGRDAPATLTRALELFEALPIDRRREADVDAVVSKVLEGWDRARHVPVAQRSGSRRRRSVAAAAAVSMVLVGGAALVAGLRGSTPDTVLEVAGVTATTPTAPATPPPPPPRGVAENPPPTSETPAATSTPTVAERPDADDPLDEAVPPAIAGEQPPREVTLLLVGVDPASALERLPEDVEPGEVYTSDRLPRRLPDDVPVVVVADGTVPPLVCFLLDRHDDVQFLGETTGCGPSDG